MPDPTFPPAQGPIDLRMQVLGLRRSLDTVVSDLRTLKTVRSVWNVPVPNRLLPGAPAAGPTAVAGGAGGLTGDFEYAYSYSSTYMAGETPLSAATATGALVANDVDLTGARSTNPFINRVNIYRRTTGTTEMDWLRVTQIANPNAGGWTYTDDEEVVNLLSNPVPMAFLCPLWVVCGPNYHLRRVKVKPEGTLDPDPANYYELSLQWRAPNQAWPGRISRKMTTELSGMSESALANAFIASEEGPPRVDLDFPLAENGTLYLGLRGVGAPDPWPELSCQIEVTRQEV